MPGQIYGLPPIEFALVVVQAHPLAILLQEGRDEFVADQRGEVSVAHRSVFRVRQDVWCREVTLVQRCSL